MFSLTILRNRADAEEVAQDTLIRAHRHLGEFRGNCSLSSWLHTIALNLSRNRYAYYYRRRHHVTQSLDCAISADNPATFIDVAASEEPNPVAEATARELTSLVAVCIEKLAPPHREILERRVLESWSYEEIADTSGISIGTVKSRIARARKRLRELLACECPEFEPETEPFEWLDIGRAWRGPQQGC
jgi:RNA polymerase sigma-70 factor (ECF subfamily)